MLRVALSDRVPHHLAPATWSGLCLHASEGPRLPSGQPGFSNQRLSEASGINTEG